MANQGTLVRVTDAVFDALVKAGLVAIYGTETSGAQSWATYGREEDDGTVTCRLLDGHTMARGRK